MNLSGVYRTALVAVVVQAAVSGWGLVRVGPMATVPVHWNAQGVVDRFASAWLAFLLMPALTLGLVGLFALIPHIEPRRANLRRSASAYRTVVMSIVILMTGLDLVVVLAGVGAAVPVGELVMVGVGILFGLIGNVLSTVRSNFMFGVRTPWTLSSDRSWDRTHRLVGRLFVLTGVVTIVLSLTVQMAVVLGVMFAMLALTLVGGIAYSYRQWQQDPDRRTLGEDA